MSPTAVRMSDTRPGRFRGALVSVIGAERTSGRELVERTLSSRAMGEHEVAGDPFEIVEEVVGGRPMRVFRDAPPSPRAIWEASAAHGDAAYLVYEDTRYTYAQAHGAV